MRPVVEEWNTRLNGFGRRDFFRGLGASALGMALWNDPLRAADDLFENETDESADPSEASVRSLALLSTLRHADTDRMEVRTCKPCDCPPLGQRNYSLKQFCITRFMLGCPCDELRQIGISELTALEWDFTKKEVRANGPCMPPIGSYAGKFVVQGDLGPRLITGKFVGTLGYDPNHPQCPCCGFPMVMGTMTGKGVRGTPAAGYSVRWVFQGQEVYLREPPDLCHPDGWSVRVFGIAVGPCPS